MPGVPLARACSIARDPCKNFTIHGLKTDINGDFTYKTSKCARIYREITGKTGRNARIYGEIYLRYSETSLKSGNLSRNKEKCPRKVEI